MSNNNDGNDKIEINENSLLNNNFTLLDLAKIQNDLLIQLRELKNEMNHKYEKEIKINQESLNEINTKFISLDAINKTFTNSISSLNVKIDNYKELNLFKKKAESQIISHEIKINNTITELNEAKFKYDKIFIDNLIVPGYIGQQAKYKNLGEYINNNIKNISLLMNEKDKMKEEIKELKNKVENMVKDVVSIIHSAELRCNMYSDNKCKMLDNEFRLENKIINDKIMEVRMNNIKQVISLEKSTQEFQKEWDKILLIKKEIDKKLIDHLLIYKTDAATAIEKYNEGRIEFDKVKRRFGNMVEFIKDVRFRKNLGTYKELSKKEIKKIANKLDFNRKSESSDSDLDNVDFNYDFITGKKIKDDIKSDEEEYEKKKKVKKLVRKLTLKNIDFEKEEGKNININNSNDKIQNVNLNKKKKTLSKNTINESDEDTTLNKQRKRLNTNSNLIKNPIDEKENKINLNSFITNKKKFEKDDSNNNLYSDSKEEKGKRKLSDNLSKTKVNFDIKKFIHKSKMSNDNLSNKKISSNLDENSLQIKKSNLNLSKRSKSGKYKKINIQINKSRKNTPTKNKEKKNNNIIRKVTSPEKKPINNPILDQNIENEQKKINQKIKVNQDNNVENIYDNKIENENNENQNQENIIQNNKISNSEYENDNEEFDRESSSSEKKIISLEKIDKSQINSYDNILPFTKKGLNSSGENSMYLIEKNDKKELNKNIKTIDKNIQIHLNSPNKNNTNLNKKIFTSPLYKKSVMKIEKTIIKKVIKDNSENNINTNDFSLNQFPISERVVIEKYLKKSKKINNNITNQFNKTYNSISPLNRKLSTNNFIPDLNLENNISLPLNINKPNYYIIKQRPKDYDPDFNFNFIELGLNNNLPYSKLYNNNKSDIEYKNGLNINLSKSNNYNTLNANYNLSKTSLNIFQKENNELKKTQNILNFNDIFPSSKKTIKFIKIGKTNYKNE